MLFRSACLYIILSCVSKSVKVFQSIKTFQSVLPASQIFHKLRCAKRPQSLKAHLHFRDNEKLSYAPDLETIPSATKQGWHPEQVHELVQQQQVLSTNC